MRTHSSYLGLLGALLLVGCPTNPIDIIMLDVPAGDAGPGDGGRADTGPRDGGPDAPGGPACGTAGRIGGPCRTPGNTCETGSMCQGELSSMGMPFTVRSGFGIEQGEADPSNPGYFREVTTPDPADDVPLVAAEGGFCTRLCDATLALEPGPDGMFGTIDDVDMDCSSCSTCSTSIGTIGLLATYILYPEEMRTFGNDTGWCRADCEFNPETNGGCPDGYTCSASGNVCVEACQSDTECQFSFENQRNGTVVTVLDPSRGTCNATTGRCEWTPTGTPHVGDACESSSDCAADVGVCINGGTCATYTCPDAEPGPSFNCDLDGGVRNGICLGNGENFGSICIAGCNTSDDCNPGNACLPLGMTAGRFTGYCLGICDVVASDPDGAGPLTAADDEIWNCRTDERCDMNPVTSDDADPNGTCRPTCTVDGDCDATLGERCELQPAPATFGFCRVPDQVCSPDALDADCFLDQVCDLLAFEGNLGLCTDGCTTDGDCAMGDVCDTARGVCRTPCTGTGAGVCTAPAEVCQAGYCEQNTM